MSVHQSINILCNIFSLNLGTKKDKNVKNKQYTGDDQLLISGPKKRFLLKENLCQRSFLDKFHE